MTAQNTTEQSHNPFAAWTTVMDEQQARTQAMMEEMNRMQEAGFAQAERGIDQWSSAMKTAMSNAQQMQDMWQKGAQTMVENTTRAMHSNPFAQMMNL